MLDEETELAVLWVFLLGPVSPPVPLPRKKKPQPRPRAILAALALAPHLAPVPRPRSKHFEVRICICYITHYWTTSNHTHHTRTGFVAG